MPNNKMPKKVLLAVPRTMLVELDFVASAEHRNRSDLLREALRRYCDNYRRANGPFPASIYGTDEQPSPITAPEPAEPVKHDPAAVYVSDFQAPRPPSLYR